MTNHNNRPANEQQDRKESQQSKQQQAQAKQSGQGAQGQDDMRPNQGSSKKPPYQQDAKR